MKILFAAILIIAAVSALVFAVFAVIKRRKAHIGKAAVLCCIVAVSAAGFALSSDMTAAERISEVHVTVSPVEGAQPPLPDSSPSAAPSASAQAQGIYAASAKSDKFHLPSCSSASRISDDNRIWFQTRDEAIAAGYSPCGKCKP